MRFYYITRGFSGGSDSEESTCNAGDPGSISGLGSYRGQGNGYHSSILAWRIPQTEEPGRLQFMLVAKSWTQLSDQPYITRVPPPTALSLDVFGCRISFFGRFQSFLLVTVQQLAVILVCS